MAPMAEQNAPGPDTERRPDNERPDGAAADAETAATVAELRARVAHLEDQWRRAVADLDNLRKRVARDSQHLRADERARVAAQWLPVIDNLDLALEHAGADPAALLAG